MMFSYTWNWLFGNIQNTLTSESSLPTFYNRWLQKIILRQWHLDSKSLNRDPYPTFEEKSKFCLLKVAASLSSAARQIPVTHAKACCPNRSPEEDCHVASYRSCIFGDRTTARDRKPLIFSVHAQIKMALVEVNRVGRSLEYMVGIQY